MGAFLDLSYGFNAPGSLDLVFVSTESVSDQPIFAALQGSSFRLATVGFTGLANGLSLLSLTNVEFSNWDGSATLPIDSIQNGNISVGQQNGSVPEPAALTLWGVLSLGGLASGWLRKRQLAA